MIDRIKPGNSIASKRWHSMIAIAAFMLLLIGAPPSFAQHADDPQKHDEHHAMLNLVNPAHATHVAVSNGNWSNGGTWSTGTVPGNNARVHIPENRSVTYNRNSTDRLHWVRIDGTLRWSTGASTTMVVDTVITTPTSILEIGTVSNPLPANRTARIIIADNGAINTVWDWHQLSRGIVTHGEVRMHGAEKTPFVQLAQNAPQGATQIQLVSAPTGWQVNDRLVLAGTRYVRRKGGDPYTAEDEELRITAVNGNTVTVSPALSFNHNAPTPSTDILGRKLHTYLGNYSRNIVIETENHGNIPANQRGHTMFMHNAKVDVRYAEFFQLGRTDKSRPLDDFKLDPEDYVNRYFGQNRVKDSDGNNIPGPRTNVRGRYSVHFHRTGVNDVNGQPGVAIGCSVWGSPGWGFVHHDSHTDFLKNVSYNVLGAHFVSEEGSEIGNWEGNLAIRSTGDNGHIKQGPVNHDVGFRGHGYWFQSRVTLNKNNIAAGMAGEGIVYNSRGTDSRDVLANNLKFPTVARLRETVGINIPAITGFKDNIVFASETAMHVVKGNSQQGHQWRSMFNGFTAWNITNGSQVEYTTKYTWKDNTYICDPSLTDNQKGTGLNWMNQIDEMAAVNTLFHGFRYGIRWGASDTRPFLDDFQFKAIGVQFSNIVDSNFHTGKDAYNIHDHLEVKGMQDLNQNTLALTIDPAKSNLHVNGANEPNGRSAIVAGTVTDSIGSHDYLGGHDTARFDWEFLNKAPGVVGYYTNGNDRVVVYPELIMDRVTEHHFFVPIPIHYVGTGTSWKNAVANAVNLGPWAFGIFTDNSHLPIGVVGKPYFGQLFANAGPTGGTSSWNIQSGSLPSGLTMNSSGRITGTPASGTNGSHQFTVRASSAGSSDTRQLTIVVGNSGSTTPTPTPVHAPYNGTPLLIPGVVQAQEFNYGGQNVAYYDTTSQNLGGSFRADESVDIQSTNDISGSYNVGYIAAGEWLEYSVDVQSAGNYDLHLRVARQSTGSSSMRVLMGGTDVSGSISIPSTGGWQTWTTVTVKDINLAAGKQIMRIAFDNGGFDLNWLEFKRIQAITANFDSGAGTASSGQFVGTSGEGWATEWHPWTGSANTQNWTAQNPITGSGSARITSQNANGRHNLRRQWTAFGDADPNAMYTLSFDFRLDALANSASFHHIIRGPGGLNERGDVAYNWAPHTGFQVNAGGWNYRSAGGGSGSFGSSVLPVNLGDTYRYSLTLDPVAKTFEMTFQNLNTAANKTVSGNLGTNWGIDHTRLFFGTETGTLGNVSATIDNIEIVGGANGQGTLTVAGSSETLSFTAWQDTYFTADSAVSGPGATPAGDGVSNLIKYAFGLGDPRIPVSGGTEGLPKLTPENNNPLVLTYRQRTDITDILYIPEVSVDMIEWKSGEPHVTQLLSGVEANSLQDIKVQGNLPADARGGFLRVRVEQRISQ